MINIISYGGGRQSTYMTLNALKGKYKYKPDIGIFVDTGLEPKYITDYVKWFKDYVKSKYNFNILYVEDTELRNNLLRMPLWTNDGKPIKRQCTEMHKIRPLRKALREYYGFKKQRHWLGISFDERERKRDPDVKYIEYYYPLCDNRIGLDTIFKYYIDNEMTIPSKSSCKICPYHSKQYYQQMKIRYPDEFKDILELEKYIELISEWQIYRKGNIRDIDDEKQYNIWPELLEECSGICGT